MEAIIEEPIQFGDATWTVRKDGTRIDIKDEHGTTIHSSLDPMTTATHLAMALHALRQRVTERTTYFPLLIRYTEDNREAVVASPDEIMSGKAFNVLKTKYTRG
jgi:hypothetical protein